MSQRDSGYDRKEHDLYETPEWVTRSLLPHVPERVKSVWEPACGGGKMFMVLNGYFPSVFGTDIRQGRDFLKEQYCSVHAIITNPPYTLAEHFISHALELTARAGFVAM